MAARLVPFGWLGVSVALFAAYALLLPPQPRDVPDGVLTLSQAHRVTGEEYLLAEPPPTAVLVGSSLSAILPAIALKPVYNLALSGGSTLTGLRLTAASAHVPALIFVEVNVIERPADETLLQELTQPLSLRLKTWCNACRTRQQPLTVALAALSRLRLQPLSAEEADRIAGAAPQALNPQGFAIQRTGGEKPVDAGALQIRLTELASLYETLSRRGSRIVFVELPVHPQIASSIHQRTVVQAVLERFPPERFDWIRFSDREYATTDGAHLTYADGRVVGRAISAASRVDPPRP
jgi:hypothetical protein